MIRHCDEQDFEAIYEIVNDAATAYRGVIPADCWTQPYMPREELRGEIAAGIDFWGYEEDGALAGVMGIQNVRDVTLIRHAYVRTASQRRGIGVALLESLHARTDRPVLIGTLGRRSLGDQLLREAWLHACVARGEGSPASHVLDGERPADRDVGRAGRADLVRQGRAGMRGSLAPFGPVEREVAT